MTNSSIRIHNIYVMMAYAFETIERAPTLKLASESFDHLHDLFAEILLQVTGAQVKRGLTREYLRREDTIPTVRGRVNVVKTITRRSAGRGQLVCEFDEYLPDTLHNQVIKACLILLIRNANVQSARKKRLRRLLAYFEPVSVIAPSSIPWSALTFHRSNANYRMLLGTCELLIKGLLPVDSDGDTTLTTWIRQEEMHRLYERFLRQYYKVHHSEYSPGARNIDWDYSPQVVRGIEQLPIMHTDITLTKGGRTLIIDAKYYENPITNTQYGQSKLHSGNLYQIFTYTKNFDVSGDGSVAGLLLYAQTDGPIQPNLDITVQGSRIGARAFDLDRPWHDLRPQLEAVLEWLDC